MDETKTCGVYINGKHMADVPELDAEAIVEDLPIGTAEKINSELSISLTDEEMERLQQALGNISRAFGVMIETAQEAFEKVAKALVPAIQSITEKVGEIIPELAEYMKHQQELREVATPRQWHQYQNGRYRVRKKWEHAFEKRLQQQKRRK